MSEVRCYYCGKAVENEKDLTTKSVSIGYFRYERKPFHIECWKKYHRIRMKKDAIAYVAIVDGAVLLIGFGLFFLSGTVGLLIFLKILQYLRGDR